MERRLTWMLAALLLASGCYKATFVDPTVTTGEEHDEWTDFFVFGIAGVEHVDVRDFCPGPVAKVATGGNVATSLVTALTLGIYAPRKVYVTCAAAPAPGGSRVRAQIDLDGDGAPVHVQRTVDDRTFTGQPRSIGSGRYLVAMQEVAR